MIHAVHEGLEEIGNTYVMWISGLGTLALDELDLAVEGTLQLLCLISQYTSQKFPSTVFRNRVNYLNTTRKPFVMYLVVRNVLRDNVNIAC